jgi:hypothetical protein
LQSDVTLSIDISNGYGCLCLQFLAAGATGSVDCDGGTAFDTTITQTPADGTSWTIQTAQGAPAGAGDATLVVAGLLQFVVGQTCAQADCANVTYSDPPNLYPFTTTRATAVVGSSPSFTATGAPVDCGQFTVSGSGGEWVTGLSLTDPNATGIGAGPQPMVLRLSE